MSAQGGIKRQGSDADAPAATGLGAADLAALAVPGFPATRGGMAKWLRAQGLTPPLSLDQLPGALGEAARLRFRSRIHGHALRLIAPNSANTNARPGEGRGRPSGTSFFDANPHVAQAVLGLIAHHQFAATTVLDLLRADGIRPLPPIHSLRRHMKRVERDKAVALMAMRDPDKHKSRHRLALGRADAVASYAHEHWELDTTKADVMTANGRRMILGVIDRWSRRALFIVATSESAMAVRHLLIRAILEWGVLPARIIVDNGAGYINATVKSACAMLGIEHRPCPPGSPERKPFVERLFGTFTRQRAVILPGFTGHNVAEAQQLRARAKKETGRAENFAQITAQDLQSILDNWISGVYEQRIHGGIGMAPLAKAMRAPQNAQPAPDEDVVRRAMTAFVGNNVVGKRGLRWKNGRYWCAELAGWIGKPVHVRRDEDDLGALLVFDGEGGFIGTAVNFERGGMSEQQFAQAARVHQAAHEKRAKAELREAKRKFSIERASAALLREDAMAAGKLAALPQPRSRLQSEPQPASQPARIRTLPMAPRGDVSARVARADGLIAAAADGHDVNPQELAWARAFATGAAYQAFKAEAAFKAGNPSTLKPPTLKTRRIL